MDKKVLSGEEYMEAQKKRVVAKKNNTLLYVGLGVGGGILLLGIGFIIAFLMFNHGGTQGNGGLNGDSGGPSLNGGGPNMQRMGGSGGPVSCSGPCSTQSQGAAVSGKVTAVSDTSITIQPPSGSTKTFSIKSSTQMVTGAGSGPTAYKSSSIHVGDEVGIMTTSSDSTEAETVLLNYDGNTQTNY